MATLFSKIKKADRARYVALLAYAVSATMAAPNFGYMNKAEAQTFVKAEPTLITVDETVVDPANAENVKIIATQAGIDANTALANAPVATESAPAAPRKVLTFTPATATAVADFRRGGGSQGEAYPFKSLNVVPAENNSLDFPVTAECSDPVKAISSVVGSANKRYAKGEYAAAPRKFVTRKLLDANGVYIAARVSRIQ